MTLEIVQVPCFTDNYAILLHESTSGETLCVDAPEARPILSALADKGWKLTTLSITHPTTRDHVGGIKQIKKDITGAKHTARQAEARDIPELDETLSEGDQHHLAGTRSTSSKPPAIPVAISAYTGQKINCCLPAIPCS